MTKDKTIQDIKSGKGLKPLSPINDSNKPNGIVKETRQLIPDGIRRENFSLDKKPQGVVRVNNHKKTTSTSKKESKPKQAATGE